MPISIPVAVTADDRTAKRVRDQYEKWGKDTGKSISSALADGISDAKLEKAFSKVGDAMSKVRAEEAKLQELRSKGASDSRVIAQAEALTRARNAETRATNDAIRAYDALHNSTSQLSAVTNTLTSSLAGTRFGALASEVGTLTSKFGGVGLAVGGAVTAFAALAVGTTEAMKALYNLGEQWDSISDKITGRTGKVGAELAAITDQVAQVSTQSADSLENLGDIAGRVTQSIGTTGPALGNLVLTLSNLNSLTGEQTNIQQLGQLYHMFGVEAQDQIPLLNNLYTQYTNTGISVNEMIKVMVDAGPKMKQIGLDAGQTAALVASFVQGGVNETAALNSFSIAIKNIANAGLDVRTTLPQAIEHIKQLHDESVQFNDASKETLAQQEAIKLFGGKAYAPMLAAIEDGRVSAAKLNEILHTQQKDINDTKAQTDDFTESWEKFKHTIGAGLKEPAKDFFDFLNSAMISTTGMMVTKVAEWEQVFRDWANADWLRDSPMGKLLNWLGVGGDRPDFTPSGLYGGSGEFPRNAGASAGRSSGLQAPSNTPWTGAAPQWDDALNGPEKKGAEAKPSFPLSQYGLGSIPLGQFPGEVNPGLPGRRIEQHTGPGAYEVDPQKVFDAQTGVISANKQVEEARKRVLEIQADNNHTEQELQSAKDALVIADRNNLKAQQDLIDAQQGTWKKAEEQTKNLTQSMESFGASLDKDFGLSKGLPGLAENLARFIGNIAAAPLLGPLGAIAGAQGGAGKTGSGLIGMLGASGAFGPGFQDFSGVGLPGSMTGASGSSPQGRGGWSDAALLSHVNRNGQYDNVTKDLSKGLVDCASGVEDLVNIIDGKSTAGGSLWTGNAASVLPGMGFVRGAGGPGDFRIGYRNGGPGGGHMQATLPGGSNVNFGSTGAIQAGGLDGSMGAFDPSFTDHWYRPIAGPGGQDQLTNPGLNFGGQPQLHDAGLLGSSAGAIPPGTTVVQNNTGKNEHIATPDQLTQLSKAAAPNPMANTPAANVGTGATQIGGAEPKAQDGSSAGGGGGLFGAAVSAGAMAADAFAPGSGAAVQIAGQEIQRAIKAGGQATGILTEGLMETFLPTGASEIANDNWLTRIAGGFVGLGPQLPNMAGKPPSPIPQQAPAQNMPLPAAPGADAGKGQAPGANVTLNINGVSNVDKSTADMLKSHTENVVGSATMAGGR